MEGFPKQWFRDAIEVHQMRICVFRKIILYLRGRCSVDDQRVITLAKNVVKLILRDSLSKEDYVDERALVPRIEAILSRSALLLENFYLRQQLHLMWSHVYNAANASVPRSIYPTCASGQEVACISQGPSKRMRTNHDCSGQNKTTSEAVITQVKAMQVKPIKPKVRRLVDVAVNSGGLNGGI